MSSPNNDTFIASSMENVNADVTTIVLTVIQVIYGVPSIVLMMFLFIYFGRSPKYRNSFYRLVQSDFFVNMLCFINTWIALRLEKFQFFVGLLKFVETYAPGFLNISKYLVIWFMNIQFLSAAVMSVHRITAVLFPQTFEKKWAKWYLAFFAVGALYSILPNAIFCRELTASVDIVNGVLTKTKNVKMVHQSSKVTAVLSVVYFFAIAALGGSTLLLVKRKINVLHTNSKVTKTLTKIAVAYNGIYSGILLWSILSGLDAWQYLPQFIVEKNIILLTFSSDMMTLALPYILIMYDGNVKKDFALRTTRSVAPGSAAPSN